MALRVVSHNDQKEPASFLDELAPLIDRVSEEEHDASSFEGCDCDCQCDELILSRMVGISVETGSP